MKKLLVFILFFSFVGFIFAEDWISKGFYKNEEAGEYEVLVEEDYTEVFPPIQQTFEFFSKMEVQGVSSVTYYQLKPEEVFEQDMWCTKFAKEGYFCTLEIYKDYTIIDFVCEDGVLEVLIIEE